jgi:hypothetical protein
VNLVFGLYQRFLTTFQQSDPSVAHRPPARPPSPLRNSFIPDTSTGIAPGVDEEGDEEEGWDRATSPSPSFTQFATNFAQRVGSLVSNMSPLSQAGPYPTDAELEAEAERERDRSRREAERILYQEAERRRVEERMRELLTHPLPPPPARSQSTPSPSPKEGGTSWWAAAKSKFTSTREPLTPAQQIIQETKAKEKEEKKKVKGKERDKSPNASRSNFNEFPPPNLSPRIPHHQPASLSSYSPSRSMPNSPKISASVPPPSSPRPAEAPPSPSREPPPLYAQFNSHGVLDIPNTLLVVARRFEKLEKWTLGHVRALEERMEDVERWLVDKEKEKEVESPFERVTSQDVVREMRDEMAEVQGRIGELGREMAKLATAPAHLSSGPSRTPAQVTVVPQTVSSIAVHARTPTRPSSTARESTSPPITSVNSGPRNRLPYPSGDYATPPESAVYSQGAFSPNNSPTSSINSITRARPASIAGLPLSSSTGSSTTSAGRLDLSPGLPVTASRVSSTLPAPRFNASRTNNVSPTPRKRYTVALGGPLVAPDEVDPASSSYATASDGSDGNADEDDKISQDEITEKILGVRMPSENGNGANTRFPPSPGSSPGSSANSALRVKPNYGVSAQPHSTSTSLRPILRSKSSEPLVSATSPALGGKFVDPLALRKQTAKMTTKVHPGKGKKAVGELVAFFDGEK